MRLGFTRFPTSCFKNVLAELIEVGTAVSPKTIQCRLSLEFAVELHKPARKPRLIKAMLRKRLDFPKRHAAWNMEMWNQVLFSNEVSVNQFSV